MLLSSFKLKSAACCRFEGGGKKKMQIPVIFVGALDLARLEETFFLATVLMLCFGFLAKAMLITQSVFAPAEQSLYRIRAFSPPHSQQAGLKYTRPWKGMQLGQLTRAD